MSSHKFNNLSKNEILNKKITIYGAYYPITELKRLRNLRNYLKKEKFYDVHLVEDYPASYFNFPRFKTSDQFIYEKSIYLVDNSDLNIFVYTYDGKLEGETWELNHSIYNDKDYLLFIETGERIPACSRVITGYLYKIGRNFIPFPRNNDEDLHITAYNRIIDYFM